MRTLKHPAAILNITLLLGGCAAARAQAPVPLPQPAPSASAMERQKAALIDADQLLQLAQQLKATLDKTRRDELSMQVIRQADEIEKLARSAKTRIH